MNTQEKASELLQKVLDDSDCGVVPKSHLDAIQEYLHPEPELKTIDLSVLIESGIDCEFDDPTEFSSGKTFIGKLTKTGNDSICGTFFNDEDCCHFKQCKPRMTPHIHAWMGGKCPLPEGLKVKLYYTYKLGSVIVDRELDYFTVPAQEKMWLWEDYYRKIVAFEVLGLADGYCWPWESE